MQYNLLYIPFLLFILSTILLTIIYLPIKQLIKTNSKNKQELASFKKWKTDASLFMAQWEKEPTCDNTIWENDLLIGNADAPIRITVACNPYCGPCAKAHKELDKLVEKYSGKVSVQIRMLCRSEDKNNNTTIAVKAILQNANNLKSNTELKNMLTDWFDWMNYKQWNAKWNTKNDCDVTSTIKKHDNWMDNNHIKYTPTIFVNGKKIPTRYEISDIENMLPQLTEVFVVV